MTVDIKQCRAFLAVVDQGSLGRAAEATHITQPALSRTLAEMERRLGHRLFERHARGMALTAAGEALLPYARLIAFEAQEAEQALDELAGLTRGNARIGAVGAIVRGLLPAVARDLLSAAPGLTITVLEESDGQLQAALRRREIDLVIGAAPPSGADIAQIGRCRHDDLFVVFCAADHPFGVGPATLDMVLEEQWVMPLAWAAPRSLFLAAVADAGRQAPVIAVETTSPDAMVDFVAAGRLLGWLPQSLIGDALAAGRIREIAVPELALRRRFRVLQRAGAPLSPAARALLARLPLEAVDMDEEGGA